MAGGSRTRGRHVADVLRAVERLELGGDVAYFTNAGVPVDGTTGKGFAGKGSMCVDRTNGRWYQNRTGTKANPVWTLAA